MLRRMNMQDDNRTARDNPAGTAGNNRTDRRYAFDVFDPFTGQTHFRVRDEQLANDVASMFALDYAPTGEGWL